MTNKPRTIKITLADIFSVVSILCNCLAIPQSLDNGWVLFALILSSLWIGVFYVSQWDELRSW